MEPVISKLSEDENVLKFTMNGINVSFANALRRIMLAEVPTLVFRTTPHEKCLATFDINTCRLNNELIKQRLSCIPIHITDVDFPFQDYQMEVNKKNESDAIEFVTTADFKLKNIVTGNYMSKAETDKIFPPNPLTGMHIDFVRLRPRISSEIDGEQLKMSCRLDVGMAQQDSAFNVVATCAYGNTPDPAKIKSEWTKKATELSKAGSTASEIEFLHKDWLLLDAKRFFINDSFDFTIETVGPFTNMSIVYKAIQLMLKKLGKFKTTIEGEPGLIAKTATTIENGFDITIPNEGYTLGKAIEFVLYNNHYGKALTYCGFIKPHPHIDISKLRVGFKEQIDTATVVSFLTNAADEAIKVFETLATIFKEK
uniref:DNA-directed RNA polymerase RpoA/D/Rpb3-type domain-containing protein n=1 Tax=viral metagenome TaxID=1070528 RepID=A0A6C0IK85_9ZZZZ